MFQIASTIGIARKNGWQFAFPEWKNYDHLERFGTSEDIDVQKYFVNKLPVYNGPKLNDSFVHWGYHPITLRGTGPISLTGHMQSEKYFINCEREIRLYFKMTDEYSDKDYCAIHVRFGDYDDNYHPRLKYDYYKQAMDRFPEGTRFIVFSDEPEKAVELFGGWKSSGNINFRYGCEYMDDFKFMKSCKHFIIGNSTYSWWAAWLSNQPGKRVIAPSNWFGAVANLSAKDIYAKGWEVI
jgi:hypothetical protein